jgi:tRNA pseudouridine55 synthase
VIDGIVLLSKPAGITSFQALGSLKKALGTGKIGHTGTLDRFAEGLLVVLAGKLTRLCTYASSLDKEYIARIRFGIGTDTLDPEGTVNANGSIPESEALAAALPSFLGRQEQVPPVFSALHIGGRRAYQAARNGEEVKLSPRWITVNEIELLSYAAPEAEVRISCSKGTYIRALARDLAERLGTCAHLVELKRTRIGEFSLEKAVEPERFDPARDLLPPEAFFDACPLLMRLTAKDEWIERIGHGMPPAPGAFASPPSVDGVYGIFSQAGTLLAVAEMRGDALRYAAVLTGGMAS